MSYLLKKILVGLAKAQIGRCQSMIIGVTGNAGKTSTKEMIAAVLRRGGKTVRIAAGNLNNEFGFALTILGNWDDEYYDEGSSIGLWLRVLWAGFRRLIVPGDSAEIFLLEYGADRPGDIRRLVKAFKPHIAIITTVGDVPVHVEFFSAKGGSQPKADQPLAGATISGGENGAEAVAMEKASLVKVLTAADYAILNHDDKRVFDMKSKTEARVITYGFEENSTIRISDFKYLKGSGSEPTGVAFKIHNKSGLAPIEIIGSLGKSQAYAAAAAAAVGTILGLNLIEISKAFHKYRGPNGRLKIIPGINRSTIIDDTYNASPAATRLALETLRDLAASRRIAVLGDMLELGEHTIPAHQDIGTLIPSCVDILVAVGSQAKFIADSAGKQMSKNNIFTFGDSQKAAAKVRQLIKEGDLILIKGSQGVRLERIVAEIMAEPERKRELLVRQSRKWLSK